MLNVLGSSASKTKTEDRPSAAHPETTDFSEKQLQLNPSPAPSMGDVLTQCLGLKHGQDNTPLK